MLRDGVGDDSLLEASLPGKHVYPEPWRLTKLEVTKTSRTRRRLASGDHLVNVELSTLDNRK